MSIDTRFDVSFPLRIDNRGRMATAGYETHVREMLEQLLFTQPGERVNRPDFGTPISAAIFDRPTDELISSLEFQVSTSVQRFMGEVVSLENVSIDVVDDQIEIILTYTIIALNQSTEERFRS